MPEKVRTRTDAAASGAAGRWRHENHRSPLASAAAHHGGKAAGLSALLTAGLPVPPGVVFDAAPSASAAGIAAAAVEVAQEYGWRSVAVRSSARDEDGATFSGAGAYATVLNVPGDDVDAMASAVDTVCLDRRDRWSDRAADGGPDAAGVVFTIDPVTGAAFLVVNAVAGLGETLVSGAETPWEARIPREATDRSAVPTSSRMTDRSSLPAPRARAPRDRSRTRPRRPARHRVGRRGRCGVAPAIAAGHRARSSGAHRCCGTTGYWVRDPTHGRLPRTRMTASVLDEDRAVRPMVEEFGMLATFSGARIGGWHYVTIVPVGAPPPAPGKTPPRLPGWLVSLLIRSSSAGRRQLRAARRAMKTDAAQRAPRRVE